MFIKVNRTNHNGESKETIVNVEDIALVKEKTLKGTNLYDSNGEFVKTEEPTTKLYKVFVKGGDSFDLDQAEYDKLVAALLK